jgi:hypothetical protein
MLSSITSSATIADTRAHASLPSIVSSIDRFPKASTRIACNSRREKEEEEEALPNEEPATIDGGRGDAMKRSRELTREFVVDSERFENKDTKITTRYRKKELLPILKDTAFLFSLPSDKDYVIHF